MSSNWGPLAEGVAPDSIKVFGVELRKGPVETAGDGSSL
jgi:hypothetical protein